VAGHQHLGDIPLLVKAEMPELRIWLVDRLIPNVRAGHRYVKHCQLRNSSGHCAAYATIAVCATE